MDIKPGYKTTEFWLSTVATIIGLVLASGSVPEAGIVGQVLGGVAGILAQLGYTSSRTKAKK